MLMAGAQTPTSSKQGVVSTSMTIPTVNFLSYNSTGLSSEKCKFVNNICDSNDVTYI